eukprot:3378896-Pyramimonas_sp.AAC.1
MLVRATSWSGRTRCAWAFGPELDMLAQAGDAGLLRPSAPWQPPSSDDASSGARSGLSLIHISEPTRPEPI